MLVDWFKFGATIMSVVVAVYAARSAAKANKESKEARQARELKEVEQARDDDRIGELKNDLNSVAVKLDSVSSDVSDIKVTVAVHEERFNAPLRSVNSNG